MKHRSLLQMRSSERRIAFINFDSRLLSLLDELILELDYMENVLLHLLLFSTDEGLQIPDYNDERLVIDVFPIDDLDSVLMQNVTRIDTAVILADSRKPIFIDEYTILLARKIAMINRSIHLIVELKNSVNIKHLGLTDVRDVICIEELNEKLISNSALLHGFSKLYMHLLYNNTDTNSIFSIPIPDYLVGDTYRYGEKLLAEYRQDIVLIGFTQHKEAPSSDYIIINPTKDQNECPQGRDYVFNPGDRLIVMAYENPDLSANIVKIAA